MYSAAQIFSLVDLTSLNDDDNETRMEALAAAAQEFSGAAAVCVYPQFLPAMKRFLAGKNIALATVVNFPTGAEDALAVEKATQEALQAGADEIDWVMPYREKPEIIAAAAQKLATLCHQRGAKLKVILETGALTATEIEAVAPLLLAAGADFLKTSTGKIPQGATLAATEILLRAIQKAGRGGLKVSGGVRTVADAEAYLQQAEALLGADFLHPARFRIGASSLLQSLKNEALASSSSTY